MAHRIKYKLLTWSIRPSMTLFWPTSPISSYDILCLTHFVPAIPTFLQFFPLLSFFNSPSLLFIPQGLWTCCSPVLGSLPQLFRWHSDDNLEWLFLIFYQELQHSSILNSPLLRFTFLVMVTTLNLSCLSIFLLQSPCLPIFSYTTSPLQKKKKAKNTHTPEYKLISLSISGI